MLTLEQAAALNRGMITQENLQLHVKNVSYAMAALARHFGGDGSFKMDAKYLTVTQNLPGFPKSAY